MRTCVVTAVALALLVGPDASAGWKPSRRLLCALGLSAVATGTLVVFPRHVDALRLGIPRAPIQPEQLTFEGFSDNNLINLRHKVANLHEVRVTAVIAGDEAVTQDELGRFLTDFLDAAGSPYNDPLLMSLRAPRTVTVVGGRPRAAEFGPDTVRVHWSQAAALVREQRELVKEVKELLKAIKSETGVELRPYFAAMPFEGFVAFARHFRVAAAPFHRGHFADANFLDAPVFVVDDEYALHHGVPVPHRSLSPQTLTKTLQGVREGTLKLPDLEQRPPPGPPL